MNLDNTSITLILIALVVFLYFAYGNSCNGNDAIDNSGSLVADNDIVIEDEEDDDDEIIDNDTQDDSYDSDETEQTEQTDQTEQTEQTEVESTVDNTESNAVDVRQKMVGRNSTLRGDGEYKYSSYKEGKRGGSPDSGLDAFFKNNAPSGQVTNNDFEGVDASGDNLAQYVPGKGSSAKDDIYNAKELLPKQADKDWFEVHNNVKVKNSHLINVYRPIGANTVSGTLRNPTWDFRGDIANPRYVVSPWLQSTIDPDINSRGLCA